jgi:hypothetical protein
VLKGLQAQTEVVAAEGLVIDKTPSDRLLIDPAVEDIWEYETAGGWREDPHAQERGAGPVRRLRPVHGHHLQAGHGGRDPTPKRKPWARPMRSMRDDDPIIMVRGLEQAGQPHLHAGGRLQQAVRPRAVQPHGVGERWWPYFILPFQSVDGEFAAQSLVDVLERLQAEHNETRDKFAELRRRSSRTTSPAPTSRTRTSSRRRWPASGEIITVNTDGAPLNTAFSRPRS